MKDGNRADNGNQGPIAMPIRTLAEAISYYGRDGYLLTIAQDGPHISPVTIGLEGGNIGCALGASAARNIAREPHVSLFWPSMEPGGYALIVNGTVARDHPAAGGIADIALTKAVLHRAGPNPAAGEGPCANDCRRLTW